MSIYPFVTYFIKFVGYFYNVSIYTIFYFHINIYGAGFWSAIFKRLSTYIYLLTIVVGLSYNSCSQSIIVHLSGYFCIVP